MTQVLGPSHIVQPKPAPILWTGLLVSNMTADMDRWFGIVRVISVLRKLYYISVYAATTDGKQHVLDLNTLTRFLFTSTTLFPLILAPFSPLSPRIVGSEPFTLNYSLQPPVFKRLWNEEHTIEFASIKPAEVCIFFQNFFHTKSFYFSTITFTSLQHATYIYKIVRMEMHYSTWA